jgi:hypothetical protein
MIFLSSRSADVQPKFTRALVVDGWHLSESLDLNVRESCSPCAEDAQPKENDVDKARQENIRDGRRTERK